MLLLTGTILPAAGQIGKNRDEARFSTGRQADQPIDTNSFDEKQRAIVRLFYKQVPRLREMEARMKTYEAGLAAMDSLLSYRNHAEMYQDSALRVLQQVRNFLAEVAFEVREMHFEWLPLQQDLMSVHTRYGELWVAGQADSSLQGLILLYRDLYGRMVTLLQRREYLYNETEFLLNSKLD